MFSAGQEANPCDVDWDCDQLCEFVHPVLPVVVVAFGSQPPAAPGKPGFHAMSAVVLSVVGGFEVDFLSREERRRYLKNKKR